MAGMAWNENKSLDQDQKQTGDQNGDGGSEEHGENAEIAVGKAHLEA
jgi:hypothetical protein